MSAAMMMNGHEHGPAGRDGVLGEADRLGQSGRLGPIGRISRITDAWRSDLAAGAARPGLLADFTAEFSRLCRTVRGWDRTTQLLAGSAAGLIPWIVVLAMTLPSHAVARNWSTVWIGFDMLMAAAFAFTARLYVRHDPRVGIMAAVVATLLIVDSWFDTSTAAIGIDCAESWLSAIFVEIPIAFFCARLAWRSASALTATSQAQRD